MEDKHVDDFQSAYTAAIAPNALNLPLTMSQDQIEPPPFLDMLTFHSSRLLPESRAEISKKENLILSHATIKRSVKELNAAQFDDSLHYLFLEPIQLPDLSHTGVFGSTSSLLHPTIPFVLKTKVKSRSSPKQKLLKVDKSNQVKLFYPTGAKNSNLRDYIQETIQNHLSTAKLKQPSHGMSHSRSKLSECDYANSPSKIFRRIGKTVKKRNKFKGTQSPVKTSLTPGALLNPQLSRQAKQVITAVRANSSKINELIAK